MRSMISILLTILAGFVVFLFTPARWRWLVLLALSIAVIAQYSIRDLAKLLGLTMFAYMAGLLIEKYRSRLLLWVCILVVLVPIFDNRLTIGSRLPGIAIGLGLSFYIFQIIAYFVETHFGRRKAERHAGYFFLYQSFFANKVAGPIERPGLLDQLPSIRCPNASQLFHSLLLIWFGLFQKFVLADQIAMYVKPVFRRPAAFEGLPATIAVLLSKYQIYCDFSGASFIALGFAGLFGISLTPNFLRPFSALTLREFWKRWHISLQIWIREYVFFPLLATPLARLGVFPILLVTFIVFGLWHGFNWTFVVYGALQAVLIQLAPERIFQKLRLGRVPVLVFNYVLLISLPGVLFRTFTLEHAVKVWRSMGIGAQNLQDYTKLGSFDLRLLILFAFAHEFALWAMEVWRIPERISSRWYYRAGIALPLLAILLFFAKVSQRSSFIYSRF